MATFSHTNPLNISEILTATNFNISMLHTSNLVFQFYIFFPALSISSICKVPSIKFKSHDPLLQKSYVSIFNVCHLLCCRTHCLLNWTGGAHVTSYQACQGNIGMFAHSWWWMQWMLLACLCRHLENWNRYMKTSQLLSECGSIHL